MGDRKERNARARASRNLYNELTYKAITFRVKADGSDGVTPEQIRASAEAAGQSVNQWIIDAIMDKL